MAPSAPTSMPNDRPTFRKYARIEHERRFLLTTLPDGVDPQGYEVLEDLYVQGSHLRVRHVYKPEGEWVATKLGQKIPHPDAPSDPRLRQMTTIYLPHAEASALEPLVGLRTRKRRYRLLEQGWTWCIDVWEVPAAAAGIIVAEVETHTLAELEALAVPSWAIREITADESYSAIRLAMRQDR
ncbi:MAG TPA: hypothetical protein VF815_17345 [Myxococcaceae bacterium]